MADRNTEPDALAALERRLKQAREASKVAPPEKPAAEPANPNLSMALRVGVEMVAGVAVGVAVGYGLDQWLGTTPWLLIVMFFAGAAGGALNTYRAVTGAGFSPVMRQPDQNDGAGADQAKSGRTED